MTLLLMLFGEDVHKSLLTVCLDFMAETEKKRESAERLRAETREDLMAEMGPETNS